MTTLSSDTSDVTDQNAPTDASSSLQHDDFRIALYYLYIVIDNVEEHVVFQQHLCRERDLCGRIRVSSEGLNGVLSGHYANLQDYQNRVEARLSLLNDNKISMDVKYCLLRHDLSVTSQLFDSLSVKATREVVSLYEPTAQDMQRQENIAQKDNKKYYRRRRRNREKHEQQQQQLKTSFPDEDHLPSQQHVPNSPFDDRLVTLDPAPHLTPSEWNAKLTADDKSNAVLLDARNVYESRVGYFQMTGIPTLLTNTRKYSSLPHVLLQPHMKEALAGKTIYMYCTGGVRCERASVFLQALDWDGLEPPQQIYQLDGGIQRYLEQYGSIQDFHQMNGNDNHTTHNHNQDDENNSINNNVDNNNDNKNEECLFRGKNFVFDPRRTDPMVGRDVVGTCLLCHVRHDDYDNGMAPCQNTEARCCKCRVLVLLCTNCRTKVRVWGEHEDDNDDDDTSMSSSTRQTSPLSLVYCGVDKCIDEGNLAEQACWLKE